MKSASSPLLSDSRHTHLPVVGRVPDSDQQASHKEEDDPQ